jgi:hypothetical protein
MQVCLEELVESSAMILRTCEHVFCQPVSSPAWGRENVMLFVALFVGQSLTYTFHFIAPSVSTKSQTILAHFAASPILHLIK